MMMINVNKKSLIVRRRMRLRMLVRCNHIGIDHVNPLVTEIPSDPGKPLHIVENQHQTDA